jgi:small-conductance mechanosensitive channel/CRP-like cAMP-binding protein
MDPHPKDQRSGVGLLVRRLFLPLILLAAAVIARQILVLGPETSVYLDAAVVFLGALAAVRLVDAVVTLWLTRGRRPFPVPAVLRGFILGVVYLGLIFAVLKNMFHVNISTYLGASAILTMILGLALQPILSNVLSGISLNVTRAFARGDWVGIGPHEGVVVDTNWRETRLLDRDSNIVVIPNNTAASERVVNFSRPDHRSALRFPLKVSPSAPAAEVLAALLEAARDCPRVLTEPTPRPYLRSFDESGITYEIKFWIDDFALKDVIMTEIGRLAWYKLRRRGIEVAVPWTERIRELARAIDTAGKSGAEAAPAGDAAAGIDRTAALLTSSSLLRFMHGDRQGQLMVPPEAVRELAGRVRRMTFAKDEVLFRQGDKGDSCYVVARGRLRGAIVTEEGGKPFTSDFQVGPGGLFGEMSLFTGMPRTATGTVEEESELIEIGAADFAVLLEKNAALAGTIADLVSARNAENLESYRKIKTLSEQDIARGTDRTSILEHLRRFVRSLR